MRLNDDSLVVLARVGRPHGVRGDVTLDRVGEHLRYFLGKEILLCRSETYQPTLDLTSQSQTLQLSRLMPQEGPVTRAGFSGIENRESAQKLTGSLIATSLNGMRAIALKERGTAQATLDALWYFEILALVVVDAATNTPFAEISAVDEWEKNVIVTLSPRPRQNLLAGTLEIPLLYPHWGLADLDRREIPLSEWQIFL